MSNCVSLTVHVRCRWVISQKPTWQAVFAYFLPSWRWFCFFSHITQDCKAKQTKSVSSPPRLYQSVSTCTSSYQTMGRSFATYTPADVTQDCNRVTEQQFQHFGTSSWNSSALRANSLDSVVGNTRDVETEFKGLCPLGAICRAISTVFLGFFSPLSLMRRQHMPQHAVAYRKTRCTQCLLSLSSSLSGHRRPKLWEMFWVKNIQAFHKAVVVITVGPFFFLFFLIAGQQLYV